MSEKPKLRPNKFTKWSSKKKEMPEITKDSIDLIIIEVSGVIREVDMIEEVEVVALIEAEVASMEAAEVDMIEEAEVVALIDLNQEVEADSIEAAEVASIEAEVDSEEALTILEADSIDLSQEVEADSIEAVVVEVVSIEVLQEAEVALTTRAIISQEIILSTIIVLMEITNKMVVIIIETTKMGSIEMAQDPITTLETIEVVQERVNL